MIENKKFTSGQGLPEYALLIVLVAIVLLFSLTNLGQVIGDTYTDIMTSL